MGDEESRKQTIDDAVEKELREVLGDKGVEFSKRLAIQRASFKTDLTNAIESGKSGPAMAKFLNNHAWLWAHLYEDVERDPQYKAMVERALNLCAPFDVPEHWHRAVKMAKENHAHVMELRRRFDVRSGPASSSLDAKSGQRRHDVRNGPARRNRSHDRNPAAVAAERTRRRMPVLPQHGDDARRSRRRHDEHARHGAAEAAVGANRPRLALRGLRRASGLAHLLRCLSAHNRYASSSYASGSVGGGTSRAPSLRKWSRPRPILDPPPP